MDTEFQDKMDELVRTGRQADLEDQKLIENMQRLVKSHDFDMYCRQVLGPRIQSFGSMLLEPSGSRGRNGEVGVHERGPVWFMFGPRPPFCHN